MASRYLSTKGLFNHLEAQLPKYNYAFLFYLLPKSLSNQLVLTIEEIDLGRVWVKSGYMLLTSGPTKILLSCSHLLSYPL